MRPAVLARLADAGAERGLAAGFEEEGVPLTLEEASGEALALAREASRRASLGIGIGGDANVVVVVLAAAPSEPYLQGKPPEARSIGTAAARLAAGRPLEIVSRAVGEGRTR